MDSNTQAGSEKHIGMKLSSIDSQGTRGNVQLLAPENQHSPLGNEPATECHRHASTPSPFTDLVPTSTQLPPLNPPHLSHFVFNTCYGTLGFGVDFLPL